MLKSVLPNFVIIQHLYHAHVCVITHMLWRAAFGLFTGKRNVMAYGKTLLLKHAH